MAHQSERQACHLRSHKAMSPAPSRIGSSRNDFFFNAHVSRRETRRVYETKRKPLISGIPLNRKATSHQSRYLPKACQFPSLPAVHGFSCAAFRATQISSGRGKSPVVTWNQKILGEFDCKPMAHESMSGKIHISQHEIKQKCSARAPKREALIPKLPRHFWFLQLYAGEESRVAL